MTALNVFKIKTFINGKNDRIQIRLEARNQMLYIPFDYDAICGADTARDWLDLAGFKIIGQCEGKDSTYIVSSTLKDLK